MIDLDELPKPTRPVRRERVAGMLGYLAIVTVGLSLIALLWSYDRSERAAAAQHFRQMQLIKTVASVDKIETSLNHLKQNLRTISFVPGMRMLKRHAEGVEPRTLAVISQLYLNLNADLNISEIYIVPIDFDADKLDPVTHHPEQPIMSFDGLIDANDHTFDISRIKPHIPGTTAELPDDDPVQGDETEEYNLLKQQAQWLQRNAPRLEPGYEANIPSISGPEVITCDNSDFKKTHNDADRKGLVFSVPLYDDDGVLKGMVSAVIRTNALKKLMPTDSMLINRAYHLTIPSDKVSLTYDAFDYARQLKQDPDLVYSTIQEIGVDDAHGHWMLWQGAPNSDFDQSAEARSVHQALLEGSTIALLLTASASIVWALVRRTIHLKAAIERDLQTKVAERTHDFEQLMDLTMRARVEAEAAKREALREANVVLEEFIAHAPAAIAMFDRNLCYIAHTQRWASLFGAEGQNFIGLHQFEALPQIGLGWLHVYDDCLNGLITRREADPLQRADGSTQWLTWEVRPWHALDGTVSGLIMMAEDVTERLAIDRELQHALQRAESAARAKADFLANMSHELRTPLSGIIGSADVLLADTETPLPSEQRKIVELQRTCGADLLSIVNDILDFSKADAGNLTLEEIPVVLADLINAGVETLRPMANTKGIVIDAAIAGDVPAIIKGDPTRLRQILLNLLSNAVKFTPADGSVRVAVHMVADDWIRFAVTDTGIGIPEAKIGNLFSRFSQADTSTTRTFGGTGLGLAISRQLVELMRGKIDVTSKPGEGSTFFFDIPASAVDAPATIGQPAHLTSTHYRQNVLVAEDNATNRMLIDKMLEKFGFSVTLVANGAEAVDAVTKPGGQAFDVVLMDIQMPVMDGETATRIIRTYEAETETAKRIPIIALTANGYAEEVEQYLAAGMDTHLLKPIDWPKLFTTIATLAPKPADEQVPLAGRLTTTETHMEQDTSGRLETHVPVAEDDQAAIDQAIIADLRDALGSDTADDIIAMFAGELDERLQRMAAHQAALDAAAEAHALASAARSVGCVELADLCKSMELKVKAGQLDIQADLAQILVAAARAGRAIAGLQKAA